MSTQTWRDRSARVLGVAAADLPLEGMLPSFDGANSWINSYQLIRQPGPIRERRFEIEFLDAGAEAFCFTFG